MAKAESENDSFVPLVGQWRLLSFEIENQQSGRKSSGFGPNPKGRLVILPGAFIVILTAAGRAVPRTDEERSAAFKQTIAYSGLFEIEGDLIKVKVDVTSNEAWGNTVQVRRQGAQFPTALGFSLGAQSNRFERNSQRNS